MYVPRNKVFLIGGISFITLLRIIAFLLFVVTGLIAMSRTKGKTKISVSLHYLVANLMLLFGGIYHILGIF